MKVGEITAEFKGDESDLKRSADEAERALKGVDRAADNLGATKKGLAGRNGDLEKALRKTSAAASGTNRETDNLRATANVADERLGHLGSTISALASNARSGGTDLGGLAGAGGNLAKAFAIGGPALLGIAALGGGLAVLVTKYMAAKKAAAELRAEQESLTDELALESVRSIGNENERLLAKNKALRAQQAARDVGGGVSGSTIMEAQLQASIVKQIKDLKTDIATLDARRITLAEAESAVLVSVRKRQIERALIDADTLESMRSHLGILEMEAAQLPEIVTENDKLRRENEKIEKSLARQEAHRAALLEKMREEKRLADELRKAFTMGLMGPAKQQGFDLLRSGLDRAPETDTAFMSTFVNPDEGVTTIDHETTSAPGAAFDDVTIGLLSAAKGLDGLSRGIDLSMGAVKTFGEELNDVTTRGVKIFLAMLTDGSLLNNVAAGRGGEAVGTQVGAVAGGVVGSFFGGAAVGEAIGGVLGSIMGESLDELVDSLGVLTPLFDAVAVIIRALSPILMVVGVFFEVIGRTVENVAPLLHQLAKPLAALLLVVVRIVELVLPLIDLLAITLSFVTTQLDFFTIGLGAVDFVMRALVNTWISVVLAFGGLHDLIIDKMRELTGFKNFGTKLDLDVRDYVARDIISEMDGEYGEYGDDQTQALDANTEALREFGRSLTNIPSGYRVPLAEYRAETLDGNGGVTFTGAVTMILDKIDSPTILGEVGRRRGYPVAVGRGRSGN